MGQLLTELHLQTNLSPRPLDFAMLIPAGLLISAKPQSLAQPDKTKLERRQLAKQAILSVM